MKSYRFLIVHNLAEAAKGTLAAEKPFTLSYDARMESRQSLNRPFILGDGAIYIGDTKRGHINEVLACVFNRSDFLKNGYWYSGGRLTKEHSDPTNSNANELKILKTKEEE